MDGNRFDQITRSMVSGSNRRGFLKGLAGAFAGVIGLKATGADAACKPSGWYCQRNTDCCSNACYASSRNRFYRVCCNAQSKDVTCAGRTCGTVTNNCGQPVNCGDCNGCQSCNGISCADDHAKCDDNDGCTSNICQSGECLYTSEVACPPPDICHLEGVCNPATGDCDYANAPNGTPCDNTTVCDGRETCQDGVCTPGTPPICDDGNVCKTDSCHPKNGCVHTPVSNGTICGACERCQDGDCGPITGFPAIGECRPCQRCVNGACTDFTGFPAPSECGGLDDFCCDGECTDCPGGDDDDDDICCTG